MTIYTIILLLIIKRHHPFRIRIAPAISIIVAITLRTRFCSLNNCPPNIVANNTEKRFTESTSATGASLIASIWVYL